MYIYINIYVVLPIFTVYLKWIKLGQIVLKFDMNKLLLEGDKITRILPIFYYFKKQIYCTPPPQVHCGRERK